MKAVFDELITGYWDKSLHKLYCKDWDSPETLDTIFFAVVRLLPPESIRDYYLNLQPRFLVGV